MCPSFYPFYCVRVYASARSSSCEKRSPIDDMNSSTRRSSFGWCIVSAIIMNAYEEELYGDYPNLNNNELPYIIGCLHTKNMEAVQKFFFAGLIQRCEDTSNHSMEKKLPASMCVYGGLQNQG